MSKRLMPWCVAVLFVPVTALAQTTFIVNDRVSAEVFENAPEAIYIAAKHADEVAIKTATARKEQAEHLKASRKAMRDAIDDKRITVDKFAGLYDEHMLVVSEAQKADFEMQQADGAVNDAYTAWLKDTKAKKARLSYTVEQAFSEWLSGAMNSYISVSSMDVKLLERGEARMKELIAAERETMRRRGDEDQQRLEELQKLLDRITNKSAWQQEGR